METINQVMERAGPTTEKKLQTQPTEQAQATGPQWDSVQVELVNWFFLRLQTNWLGKYDLQFSGKNTLLLAKREWTKQITQYTREQLHTAIEGAKKLRLNGAVDNKNNLIFDYPDIAKILALLNKSTSPVNGRNSAAYIGWDDPMHPRNDPTSAEYVKPSSKLIGHDGGTGKAELDKMKGLFK